MKLRYVCVFATLLGQFLMLTNLTPVNSAPQDGGFELPVQLLGFPVIIIAVRLSNFVKKLAYSLNPRTYVGRSRRDLATDGPMLDVLEVEKRLVAEMGEKVCVFEDVCEQYAKATIRNKGDNNHLLNWDQVVREFKSAPSPNKENYLLSVFLGDIIASPNLCHQLVKRGRGCPT